MRYMVGCSASLTGRARMARMASLSLFQYPYAVDATPSRANAHRYWPPPITLPSPSSSAQMTPNSSAVFSPL